MANGPEGAGVTLVGSGVRRQVAVNYGAGDATFPVTNGMACNVAGTVEVLDAVGNQVTRYMQAGIDYPWEATGVKQTGTTPSMGITALYSR